MIVIIPIKKNSNRVKGKNFRLFGEIPLYQVILNTIAECPEVTEICIDTDCPKLIKISPELKLQKKIRIIERPDDLRGDDVSVNRLIEYNLSLTEGEYFLQTHCTNPLLKSKTISEAIHFFLSNIDIYDSIFSVSRIQSRLYDSSYKPINHNPGLLLKTQDLDPIYEENSNFYIFSRESFFKNNSTRIGKKPYFYEINKLEAIDIDEEIDFILAEILMKNMWEQN